MIRGELLSLRLRFAPPQCQRERRRASLRSAPPQGGNVQHNSRGIRGDSYFWIYIGIIFWIYFSQHLNKERLFQIQREIFFPNITIFSPNYKGIIFSQSFPNNRSIVFSQQKAAFLPNYKRIILSQYKGRYSFLNKGINNSISFSQSREAFFFPNIEEHISFPTYILPNNSISLSQSQHIQGEITAYSSPIIKAYLFPNI